jgi:hypothetical protein
VIKTFLQNALPERFRRAMFDHADRQEKAIVRTGNWKEVRSLVRKLSNPLVKDIYDIQPWIYYDRQTSGAGTTPAVTLPFFLHTMNQAGVTQLDTNMIKAGELPSPKHLLVMMMRFIVGTQMAVTDVDNLINKYFVRFIIGDKPYAEGHMDNYPGGAGIYGATTQAGQSWVNNGYPNPLATNNWGKEYGLHILQTQNFRVELNAPVATALAAAGAPLFGTGLNVRCDLDGILYREVQ